MKLDIRNPFIYVTICIIIWIFYMFWGVNVFEKTNGLVPQFAGHFTGGIVFIVGFSGLAGLIFGFSSWTLWYAKRKSGGNWD